MPTSDLPRLARPSRPYTGGLPNYADDTGAADAARAWTHLVLDASESSHPLEAIDALSYAPRARALAALGQDLALLVASSTVSNSTKLGPYLQLDSTQSVDVDNRFASWIGVVSRFHRSFSYSDVLEVDTMSMGLEDDWSEPPATDEPGTTLDAMIARTGVELLPEDEAIAWAAQFPSDGEG